MRESGSWCPEGTPLCRGAGQSPGPDPRCESTGSQRDGMGAGTRSGSGPALWLPHKMPVVPGRRGAGLRRLCCHVTVCVMSSKSDSTSAPRATVPPVEAAARAHHTPWGLTPRPPAHTPRCPRVPDSPPFSSSFLSAGWPRGRGLGGGWGGGVTRPQVAHTSTTLGVRVPGSPRAALPHPPHTALGWKAVPALAGTR